MVLFNVSREEGEDACIKDAREQESTQGLPYIVTREFYIPSRSISVRVK